MLVCGIATSALTSRTFFNIFNDEINTTALPDDRRLTLQNCAVLLHHIDQLLNMPSTTVLWSAFPLIMGLEISLHTADCKQTPNTDTFLFNLVAWGPGLLYITAFCFFRHVICSHCRRFQGYPLPWPRFSMSVFTGSDTLWIRTPEGHKQQGSLTLDENDTEKVFDSKEAEILQAPNPRPAPQPAPLPNPSDFDPSQSV
jgi:hypothetical protein